MFKDLSKFEAFDFVQKQRVVNNRVVENCVSDVGEM